MIAIDNTVIKKQKNFWNACVFPCPRELEFRTELPKTLVGKVAYRVLEEEAAGEAANQ